MIVVTGANGTLGNAVVRRLLDHVPVGRVAASVRDPEADTARDLAGRGVRVRRGDFADPSSLAGAFEGAERVLLVSSNSSGTDAVRQHRAAVEAAAAAGTERVLYTSHQGSRPNSPFPPMPDHAATEEVLARSGIAYTSLRNGFYAASAVMLLGDAVDSGELRLPADGPVAWTAHADLAEVAARALAGDVLADVTPGPTPPLTGPEALDMAQVAALASEITGRPIRRVVVDDEEYRSGLVGRGVPAAAADMLTGLFTASRRGDFGPADPALAGLLGRPAIGMREVLTGALVAA